MITGQGNEYIAISAIQGGAQEYLKKGSFYARMSEKKSLTKQI